MHYHSGYLTIKSYNPTFDVYRLDFPDDEHRAFRQYRVDIQLQEWGG